MPRRTAWGIFIIEDEVNAAATQDNKDMTAAFKLDMGVSTLDGFTLVRTIGTLCVRSDTVQDGLDTGCVLGMTSWRGVSVDLDPAVNNNDWFWWDGFTVPGLGRESLASDFETDQIIRRIDSRAQRKLTGTDMNLFACVKNTGATVQTWSMYVRMLFKLP